MNARTFFLFAALYFLVVPAKAQSLYADPTARQTGDAVTIILAERTSAQRESGWKNQSSSGLGGDASVSNGISGRFGLDARFNKAAQAENESVQSDLLRGTITALVVGTDEAGNLLVEGERKLSVNGEGHLLRVSGTIRPFDVRYDNTVLSHQIANATIEYHRDGLHRKFFKPGMFVRFGAVAVLAAAIAFAVGS